MFCTKCGAENQDDARFCSKCGQTVAQGSAQPALVAASSAPASAPATASAKPRRKTSWVVRVVLAVFWLLLAVGVPKLGTFVSILIAAGAIAYMAGKLKAARASLVVLTAYAAFVALISGASWSTQVEKAHAEEQQRAEAARAQEAQEQANAQWDSLMAKAKGEADGGDHATAVATLFEANKLRNATRPKTAWLAVLRDSAVLSNHEEGLKAVVDGAVRSMSRAQLEAFLKSRALPDEIRSDNAAVNAALVKAMSKPAGGRARALKEQEREAEKKRKEQEKLAAQQAKEQLEAAKEQRLASQYKVGQTFTLGDFSYAIQKVKKRRCIGGRFSRTCASRGASFIVVFFGIRNDSKRTETVLTDDFRIMDAGGNTYRASSEAGTALLMSGASKDFALSELQPGLQKDSMTAFEIPDASWKEGVKLVVPEKGFLGAEEATVRLN